MAKKLGLQPLKPVATVQRLSLTLPDTSKFERLARSLDEFGGNVAAITIRKTEEQAESQEKAGEQEAQRALAEGRVAIDDAEAAGLLTRGQHPFFQQGVWKAMGRAKADAFGNALTVAYGEMVPAETLTPQDVDDVIASVAAEFSTDDDNGAMLEGFSGVAERHAQRLRDAHAGIVASNMQKAGDEALQANYMADLRRLSEFTGPNRLKEIASLALVTQAQWMETLGRNMTRKDRQNMNDALVDSVELLLSEDGGDFTGADAKEFLLLMQGGSGPLLNIKKYGDQINKAINSRAVREQTKMANENAKTLRAQALIGAQVRAEFESDGYTRDGLALLVEQVTTMNNQNPQTFDPGFIRRATADQVSFEQAAYRDVPINPDVSDALLLGFMEEDVITTTFDQIKDAAINGEIPHTYALELMGMLKEEKEERRKDPRMERLRKETRDQLKGALGGFTPTAMTEQAFRSARRQMFQKLRSWADANPDLDEKSDEYEAFLKPLVTNLMKEFMVDHAATLGPSDVFQREYLLRQFVAKDSGLPVESLIDLLAQNNLLSDRTNSYQADDTYYDFFLGNPDLKLSEWDVKNNSLTRRAILAQLRHGGVDTGTREFKRALEEQEEQQLAMRSVRRPSAATLLERQAASMGITPEEVRRITELNRVADSLATAATDKNGDGVISAGEMDDDQ